MSEENRAIAKQVLGYPIDLPVGGTAAKDEKLIRAITKALDEAERRGAEQGFLEGQKQMRERAAKLVEESFAMHEGYGYMIEDKIRAMEINDIAKDGRE